VARPDDGPPAHAGRTVADKRLKGGVPTSVNGPLRRVEGDNFVVGVELTRVR